MLAAAVHAPGPSDAGFVKPGGESERAQHHDYRNDQACWEALMLADFAIAEPRSVDEAISHLSDDDETVRPIAGGTGLGLLMRYGFFQPTRLVSLRRLPGELSRIEAAADGSLTIGALATARDLERSPVVAEHAPMLLDALSRLSRLRVRNVATLGGSLAHGHPQQDLPPVLIALD